MKQRSIQKRFCFLVIAVMPVLLTAQPGSGSKSPMHPHHRPSVADGVAAPVPGLLSGGPNPGRQDSCRYEFSEPETAFSNTDCSYASNEIAINWNAPLVYVAHAIEALSHGFSKK